ncbi:hypothetical protein ACP70R_038834 [Stipagrostis hirtigluma subsp. patula]
MGLDWSVVHNCYSVETFSKAYGFNIGPCSDKSKWEKVNGTEILPPVYEKKVGRAPKSRRKQPHEVQGKYEPKLSKPGVVIHCRHYEGENHNAGGCELKKSGISSEEAKKMVATPLQPPQGPINEPVNVIMQDVIDQHPPASQLSSQLSTTMFSQMMSEASQSSVLSQPPGPLPNPAFIMTNRPMARPAPLTTCTKEGKAAAEKKRKAKKTEAAANKKRTVAETG